MDIFHSPIFVGHHHIRIFSDDVDLLDPLLVEVVQIVVIVLFVAAFAVFEPFDLQLVVQDHKAAFQVQDSGLRKEQERLFGHPDINLFREKSAVVVVTDKSGQREPDLDLAVLLFIIILETIDDERSD